MKKLGFIIMPLMVVSFLVGCGGPTDYKFDFVGTNCSADNEASYKKDTEVSFMITANDGCFAPAEVNVVGTTTYQYTRSEDKLTATFSCTMPASDVKVTAEAKNGYTFTFRGTKCTANNEEMYEQDQPISILITPDPFCMLPPNLSSTAVRGVDEYEYDVDKESGIAMFSCTMKANVTMTVMAKEDPAQTLTIVDTTDKKKIPSYMDAFQSLDIFAIKQGGEPVAAEFTSSDESILSITEGTDNKVTIKGEEGGSATITCKASGYPTCARTIKVIPLRMSIKQDDGKGDLPTSMYQEDTFNLAAYDTSGNKVDAAEFSTEDRTITITKENDKVVLTGISEGDGKIVCKAKGYQCEPISIFVKNLKNMVIKLANGDPMPSAIELNEPTGIVAYEEGIHIITSGVEFTSSDNDVIAIDSSTNEIKITGKVLRGKATITATGLGYRDATCTVEVKQTYNVTCTDTDAALSNDKASTDKDYTTTITVSDAKVKQGYSVPENLNGVTIGSSPLNPEDYTYTPNESNFSAELTIPKEKIDGAVNIDLTVTKLTELCFTSNKDNNSVDIHVRLGWQEEIIDVKNLQYKINDGSWATWPVQDDDVYYPKSVELPKAGDKLYIKNTTGKLSTSSSNYISFWPYYGVTISGNINSMINGPLTDYCFFRLFEGFSNMDDIFGAPALPADTLAPHCYDSLFPSCSGLKTAPALPATKLADYCYYMMFEGCTGLTKTPKLPAEGLKTHCYMRMFYGCTGLTKAPELPATTLERYCYYGMFNECTSLTSVPTLPATTLEEYCYCEMFSGCSSLSYVKVKFGEKGKSDWPTAKSATNDWLNGVAKKGTFGWKGNLEGPTARGANTVPNNWSVVIIG